MPSGGVRWRPRDSLVGNESNLGARGFWSVPDHGSSDMAVGGSIRPQGRLALAAQESGEETVRKAESD
jgi:hypothetical protein